MTTKVDLLSELLREMEIEMGARDLSRLALTALIDSIKALKAETPEEFCGQFKKLTELVSNTEPKYGILNFYFASLQRELLCNVDGKKFIPERWKGFVIKKINHIVKDSNKRSKLLLTNAATLNVDEKVILIHDNSHTVQDVLVHLHRLGQKFRVIVIEQDLEKTQSNIERLQATGIPFQVVPAYMISHLLNEVDMLFFGALTLKDTMNFVMSPGTHGILTEFQESNAKTYLFMSTTKFSLWESKERGEIYIRKHMRKHHLTQVEYERIKYSHDRIGASSFNKIITDEGVFTPEEIKKVYMQNYKLYKNTK